MYTVVLQLLHAIQLLQLFVDILYIKKELNY